MSTLIVLTFDGGYGRSGVVEITDDYPCSRCGKKNIPVLTMDGSKGEYGSADLCEPCIADLFSTFRAKSCS